MHRRTFLSAAAGATLAAAEEQAPAIPIVDTHIHLFDPTRPEGVPWPGKDNRVLYQPALPERYRQIAVPLGIRGAIEVECSTWLKDNQWVLDIAAKDTIIVGTVGNLEPGKPEFRKQLERFHRNPLFLSIRYGNLWGRNLVCGLSLSPSCMVSSGHNCEGAIRLRHATTYRPRGKGTQCGVHQDGTRSTTFCTSFQSTPWCW